MDISDTDFALFGLPEQFAQDRTAIEARWKELQREAHPDRFAAQGAAAQRVAMQWSVRINEAHQRLKNPLRRAAYLCELRGAAIDAERNTAMPAQFLHEQIEWREALDEASSEAELDALVARLERARSGVLTEVERLLDQAGDSAGAAQQVRALMFLERFAHAVEARFDQLGQ
ncbi:Fe-S protein assembly co-chaperone HscB [Ramlibacter tataouinensis]|uniref:Fe-S protein assembly co-chaperone HscB n=1 Tax=Ramlibacter tataouinensis TaxID=94132 RepID=UPI0022F3935C|nr:Fe-S protein assembly co-chaperone HscB [Ramlibacter tataouinensis]WBY01832.1 Fe-S protein assembly co-chaperone HscB [Ramlibacter tataouinensis]